MMKKNPLFAQLETIAETNSYTSVTELTKTEIMFALNVGDMTDEFYENLKATLKNKLKAQEMAALIVRIDAILSVDLDFKNDYPYLAFMPGDDQVTLRFKAPQ